MIESSSNGAEEELLARKRESESMEEMSSLWRTEIPPSLPEIKLRMDGPTYLLSHVWRNTGRSSMGSIEHQKSRDDWLNFQNDH